MWISKKRYNRMIDELNQLRGHERKATEIIEKYREVSELTTQIDEMQVQLDQVTSQRNYLQRRLEEYESDVSKIDSAGTVETTSDSILFHSHSDLKIHLEGDDTDE